MRGFIFNNKRKTTITSRVRSRTEIVTVVENDGWNPLCEFVVKNDDGIHRILLCFSQIMVKRIAAYNIVLVTCRR